MIKGAGSVSSRQTLGAREHDKTDPIVTDRQVKLLALDDRNGPRKCMQYLKPSTLKILIGMVRKADAVSQIKVDLLNDADSLPVFPHGDRALLDNGLVFALG